MHNRQLVMSSNLLVQRFATFSQHQKQNVHVLYQLTLHAFDVARTLPIMFSIKSFCDFSHQDCGIVRRGEVKVQFHVQVLH